MSPTHLYVYPSRVLLRCQRDTKQQITRALAAHSLGPSRAAWERLGKSSPCCPYVGTAAGCQAKRLQKSAEYVSTWVILV